MRVCYHPDYVIDLPEDHPFPMPKFAVLREILLRESIIRPQDIISPDQAPWEDLLLFHTADYLDRLRDGRLTTDELRLIRLPWTEALVRRSRLAVRGTCLAVQMALEDGLAANLAGGTHHAFAHGGEGFCVLNDVAIAIRVAQRDGLAQRVLIVDLDVHQGNGNAAAFAEDERVYTFSMHGERNYPRTKPPSSLDVGLPNAMTDADYLAALREHLPRVLDAAAPELVIYLAGVDVHADDRYGRLALTRSGLYRRDRFVIETMRGRDLPLTLLLSGGYAKTPEMTADLHAITHRAAAHVLDAGIVTSGV
jgi:acetoin utilization deacetylase AcuC-like enzyme